MSNQCFDHNHMTVKEYGLYCYIRAISHESGVFYMDGRAHARQFAGVSKDTMYRLVESLHKKGWLILTQKSKRTKLGTYTPGRYTTVDHDTWTANHKGKCQSSPRNETGSNPNDLPVPTLRLTSPSFETDQSSDCVSPVSIQGHRFEKRDLKRENGKERSELSPVSKSRQALAHDSSNSTPLPAVAAGKTIEERVRAMDAAGHDNETIAARFGMTEADVVKILNTPVMATGAQQ